MNLKVLICLITVLVFSTLNGKAQVQTLDVTIDCADQVVDQIKCIKFKASSIDELTALSFTIVYDPTVLEFVDPPVVSSCLTNLAPSSFNNSTPGIITFIWFNDPINITSECELFSLCFKYIGQPGESSLISLNSIITYIEAVSELGKVNVNINDCVANVLPFGRSIVTKYCNPSTMTSDDGNLCFYGIGGVPPYNYSVVNSGGTVISTGVLNDKEEKCLTGLPKSTYTITILDNAGIVFTPKNVIMIDFGTNPTFDVKFNKPSCFYRNDGTMEITNINVATSTSKIVWSNGLFNTNMQSELLPGLYTATVIDGNGCKTSKPIDLTVDTLKLKIDVLTPGRCKGLKDAEIKITVSGGTPDPLTNKYDATLSGTFAPLPSNPFVWLNAPTGKFTLKVRDYAINYVGNVNPCIVEQMIDIPYTDTIKFQEVVVKDIMCKGKGLGKVEVKFSGTGTSYTLTREQNLVTNTPIKPGGGILANVKYINDSLKAGKYFIIAKSNIGCLDSFKWEIKEPSSPFVVNAVIVQPNCSGGLGSVKLNPSGGMSPYTIKWDDGDASDNRINLQAGDYKVTVSDFFQCDTVLTISLKTGGDPKPVASVLKAITCNNLKNGEIVANIPGTGTTITYLWKDKSGGQWNTKTVTGLGFGKYYVTVTVDGCIGMDSVILANPDPFKITDVQIIQPECPKGGARGSIGLTLSGGFQPYIFEWKKQGNSAIIGDKSVLPNLESGIYLVTIKDQNACSKDTSINLTPPSGFAINVTNILDVKCNGDLNGSANAKASLGPVNNGKYTFFWSNGQKSSGLFDMDINLTLGEGKNWVFVTDSKCVSDTVFFNVGAPPPIITNVVVTGICSGDCKGQIEVTASGGSAPPLVVSWPTLNETGNVVYNLCLGAYPYQVKDGTGCIFKDTVVLSPADTLKMQINDAITKLLSCRNSIGQIGIEVSGGKPIYTFVWTGSPSLTNIANNLSQGTYTVTVTDGNGCTNALSYTLSKPDSIVAVIPPLSGPDCFGGKTCIKVESVTGGTGNYTMQINNGFRIPIDSCLQLFSGKYLVSIYDGSGCRADYPVVIPEKAAIEVDLGEDIKVNLGEKIDKIEPIINNEYQIVNFNWQNLKDLACLDSFCQSIGGIPKENQTIKLIVTDENGCTGIDELNIEVSDERNVFIPNIFNLSSGDERNKKFEVTIGFGVEVVEEIAVFDRWGTIVHKRQNYIPDLTTGWDGTLAGQPALPGVYVFRAKIKFIDGVSKVYFGDVTLFK